MKRGDTVTEESQQVKTIFQLEDPRTVCAVREDRECILPWPLRKTHQRVYTNYISHGSVKISDRVLSKFSCILACSLRGLHDGGMTSVDK